MKSQRHDAGDAKRPPRPAVRLPRRGMWLSLAALAGLGFAGLFDLFAGRAQASSALVPAAAVRTNVTFNRDIAPITLNHCAGCHRPGESGPFSLITYAEVKKHARDIRTVTQQRLMPPWLPDAGEVEFVGARRLTGEQIALIDSWVQGGMPEGVPGEMPPVPQWPGEWQLGTPDLVIRMERPYVLPAEGKDVYRNLVVPIPLATNRYVSAYEFRPGNRAVHHAFIRFDQTGQSRRLAQQGDQPGFDGMDTPDSAEGPEGYFLSWQPGKRPMRNPEGMSWTLRARSDLVLQLHMQPTGKPESIQPEIAFFFTDHPPTQIPFKIALGSYEIDIPAGEKDYRVHDEYVLPVDVQVLGLLPHAHYLGKQMKATAQLPDGSQKMLLMIRNWDFNWQGDYRFVQPVSLPKGTRIAMEYNYDNSTNNIRNPSHPPRRVEYGLQTTDEMAGLIVQFLLRDRTDLEKISGDYQYKVVKGMITFNRFALRQNPQNAKAHTELGKALFALGKKNEAAGHFQQAIAINPAQGDAHYHLGLLFEERNNPKAARREYELALKSNPDLFEAHNNLGLLLMQEGRLAEAAEHFEAVIRIHPDDSIAPDNLALVRKAQQRR